jgi:hypothetical protein
MIPENLTAASHEFSFASRDIDPSKKGKDYCLQNARSIYALHLRNKTSWGVNGFKDFSIARDYSRGTQDVSQYKSWLLNDGSAGDGDTESIGTFDDTPVGRESKRKGYMNILFENVSPAPQYMNAIHGMMDKLDYDIMCDTIDANSKALKEEKKFVKLVESQNAEWQTEYKKKAGIPVDENVVFPKSIEELDMYEAKDGFKLNVARAMQKLLRYSFNLSDWDGTIRKKVVDDLITIGYAAVRDVYDTEDGKWKVKYIDPARLVIQYSNEYDYNDAEYVGYFCYWTISNLRDKMPEVAEMEWQNLAKACYTLYGNPRDRWQNFYSELDPTTGTYRYDGFKVPVFEVEWMDTDIQKKLYYKSVRGRDSIIPLPYDEKVKPLDDEKIKAGAQQEVKHIFKRVVRQAFWVLNTDFVFDYGIVNMAAREGLSKPHLTFHVEQLLQPSLIKRMIPILDQISQLFLRWQNSLAMMVERGYAINTSMLANVTFGGNKLRPAEVLKMWRQTGIYMYSYSNNGVMGQYGGGAALPITPTDGGLGTRVEETMRAMEMQFSLLERLTGINPVSLGGTPDPNAPVGTTQAAMQGTTNVLKPILDSIFEIKKSVATSIMRRMQLGIRNNDKIREAYAGIISPSDMQALVLMEAEGVQYGIDLKPKPDGKQKARFENWINIALQNVREQRPGIDLPDAIYFMSMLENGADLLDLEKQLQYIIEKNKQEAAQQSERMIQAQGEQNMAAQKQKSEEEAGKIQLQGQVSMQEEQVRGQVKDSLLTKEFNMRFLEQLKASADAEEGIQVTNTSRK